MKAARLHNYSHEVQTNFRIDEIDQPKIGPNEILIKVKAFGLNYADVMAFKGYYKAAPPLPAILGYDAVGTIVSMGEDVKGFELDDYILALTRFGAYAEYAIVNPAAAIQVDPNLNASELLSLATQGATAFHMFQHLCQIIPNKPYRIMTYAATGGLGRVLIQMAQQYDNIEIYGLCSSDTKAEDLKKMGVKAINHIKNPHFREELSAQNITFDYVFNSVGGKSIPQDYDLLKTNGLLLLYGVASLSQKKKNLFNVLKTLWQSGFKSPLFLLGKSKGIYGVNMLQIADNEPEIITAAMKGVYQLYLNQTIQIHPDQDFKASEVNEALAYLASGKSKGKISCYWD